MLHFLPKIDLNIHGGSFSLGDKVSVTIGKIAYLQKQSPISLGGCSKSEDSSKIRKWPYLGQKADVQESKVPNFFLDIWIFS